MGTVSVTAVSTATRTHRIKVSYGSIRLYVWSSSASTLPARDKKNSTSEDCRLPDIHDQNSMLTCKRRLFELCNKVATRGSKCTTDEIDIPGVNYLISIEFLCSHVGIFLKRKPEIHKNYFSPSIIY